ncbi:bifunctional 1-(5-phosphoribosyl)-5-((5-phosphoribosylamino)methylideneamino)imidazole-4-carboxamide isomerase/phosphoribosylanthranilate isomerase PriA [Parenemella sanctibonifatiensis]|uniref:bifunctional 1-(5-phosphoribosyl)-5-((5- phosphoribosylamino)methylideneamino)imidazole-4- carboxamide isomerase/phosphoribosylanthranilate isomerase PriA n=1 Tax=Parenemella sanctibonifatiensis TaxID=2016505 RepID=UPI001E4C2896|nr:bifunctional 1-(5-phosphoribosyl)-5-((5-phosphoribosylamino)methylideneamino)imidazole-4-carboxamide isomerase/phosphoribosylanthranilate isomerase PriA [Parenemella sanctibonifatiensis]
MENLTLLPAVDIKDGQAVQLVQGVAGTEKTFGDPLQAAQRWIDAGAEWIHMVDLNAAFGDGDNADLIAALAEQLRGRVKLELSGGIRDDATLDRALATGCARVNIGTAALESPQWCAEIIGSHGEQIAIGLDVRGDRLAARGWTREGGDLLETLAALNEAGCQRYVVTDVASDGMLTGPNLELLGRVCARTDAKVIASGGISSLEDIRRLAGLVPIGVEGAIIGTALYVGNFTLPEALAVANRDDVDSDQSGLPL